MPRISKPIGPMFSNWPVRVVICVAVAFVARFVFAENPPKPSKASEILAKDAGTWDCDVKMFFKGPQAPPAESKGVEENTLLCGGKYLQSSFEYAMGKHGKFQGHSLLGYDPRSKNFVGTWVDNMTAAPSQINAEFDEQARTLTDHRTALDSAGNEFKSKLVTTWLDDSKKKLEIFMIVEEGGKKSEVKLMEMTSTKRK